MGLIENRPNSRNVVPGEVFFTVDLRHPDEKVLDRMEAEYQAALPKIAAELGLELEEKRIWNSPAVKFAPNLIDCVREGASRRAIRRARWRRVRAMTRPISRGLRRPR